MTADNLTSLLYDKMKNENLTALINPSFTVGRFHVASVLEPVKSISSSTVHSSLLDRLDSLMIGGNVPAKKTTSIKGHAYKQTFSVQTYFPGKFKTLNACQTLQARYKQDFIPAAHPYARILSKIQGDTKVYPGGIIKLSPINNTKRPRHI